MAAANGGTTLSVAASATAFRQAGPWLNASDWMVIGSANLMLGAIGPVATGSLGGAISAADGATSAVTTTRAVWVGQDGLAAAQTSGSQVMQLSAEAQAALEAGNPVKCFSSRPLGLKVQLEPSILHFDSNNMAGTPKFKIGFGKVARTLVCEDAIGTICFTFDIGKAGSHANEHGKLLLDPRPLALKAEGFEYMSVADNDRVAAAFEQARAYAASRGYLVESP